ncbi:MAG: NHL repeat-containing protein [Planctomycetota bacterium]|jgi:DNA-binding beta-propeller fold protein YncE
MKVKELIPAVLARTCSLKSSGCFGRMRWFCAGALFLLFCLGSVVVAVQRGADSKNAPIRVRTKTEIFGPEGKPFAMPSDAAVGTDGTLYVLDGVHHRVVVCDSQGSFRFEFGRRGGGSGELLFPLGIAAGADGNIYVADSGNHRFSIFSSDGRALKSVELPRGESGAAPDPTDIALDLRLRRLYIADNDNHRLHIYDLAAGRFAGTFGEPGLGQRQFRFPFLMDISADGYIFVVEPINTRVQVLNPRGKFVNFVGAWGVDAGQLFRPKGVAILGERVFVTDSYLGLVKVFDLRGGFHGLLTDTDGQAIKLVTPTGIAADAKRRRLYVVELKANRVCRMDLE